ncbi:MAG: cobalt ECF transporter T component CbiQ [Chloroflexaceae bacterium]|nr:cobalt ECF transporter T component CbiQ [Chloroflexaceae bacterium]
MHASIDAYAYRNSPIHRWELRSKCVGLFVLLFTFASLQNLALLLPMLLVSTSLYMMTGLPGAFIASRLRYPGTFLLVIVVLAPFLVGQQVLIAFGPLSLHREGLSLTVLIAARFIAIITVAVVLFGTAPFVQTIKALRALGLPATLTDMTLFAYRYVYELETHLTTMQQAMHLRGFVWQRFNQRNLRLLAALMGSLLIRSYEQAERVYQAMRLRGYGHAPRRSEQVRPGRLTCWHWLSS